jgi:hypothetical protein
MNRKLRRKPEITAEINAYGSDERSDEIVTAVRRSAVIATNPIDCLNGVIAVATITTATKGTKFQRV